MKKSATVDVSAANTSAADAIKLLASIKYPNSYRIKRFNEKVTQYVRKRVGL